jgi:hypothetical protein
MAVVALLAACSALMTPSHFGARPALATAHAPMSTQFSQSAGDDETTLITGHGHRGTEEMDDRGSPAAWPLENIAAVAMLLGTGMLPGRASAADTLDTGLLLADAESLDIIAIIVVPLIVGGGLVAFLAANYEKFIDKINDGR